MNNFLEALEELIFRGLELFLTGTMILFLIALLITPTILTFFANGQTKAVGIGLLIIEGIVGLGLLAENCY